MSSKAMELMERAKRAKAAKESGEPMQPSVVAATKMAEATTPATAAPAQSSQTKESPFASLSRGEKGIKIDLPDDQFEEHIPVQRGQMATPSVDSKPTAPNSVFTSLVRRPVPARATPLVSPSPKRNVEVAPDPAWTKPTIPAGSAYDEVEWAHARKFGTGEQPLDIAVSRPGLSYCVFEMRNGGQGALIAVPRAPETIVTKVFTGTKKKPSYEEVRVEPTAEQCLGTMSPLMAQIFEDCLVLGPHATTTHPGAVSANMKLKTGDPVFNDIAYRIVRPESQKETHFWLYGLNGEMEPDALGTRFAVPVEPELDPIDEETTQSARQAMRG